MSIKLSVIIPTFNESDNNYLLLTLERLSQFKNLEIIISDGGSTDNTIKLATKYTEFIIINNTNSRAERINAGLNIARGKLILLHHPRSMISSEGIQYLIDSSILPSWGGFTHSFDIDHPILKFTSWYSNKIRASLFNIIYLDHCIFLSAKIKNEMGELPNIDVFEDTVLSKLIYTKFKKPVILPFTSITSAVRFKENGIIRQSILNQFIKLLFHLGIDHKTINKIYEKTISLNSKYK